MVKANQVHKKTRHYEWDAAEVNIIGPSRLHILEVLDIDQKTPLAYFV